MGVPLAVAFRGIDRYCERYYAKGPKRRPVRIDFCEADILELFDDWRRAVGVSAAAAETDRPAHHDRGTLPAHLDRVIARLTAKRGGRAFSATLDRLLEDSARELDRARARAKQVRGDERASLIGRLAQMDRDLIAAAIVELDVRGAGRVRARRGGRDRTLRRENVAGLSRRGRRRPRSSAWCATPWACRRSRSTDEAH